MKNIKIIFALLLSVIMHSSYAQQKIVLEKVRCFSGMGPVMSYWRNEEVKKTFVKELRQSLLRHQNLQLPEQQQLEIELLPNISSAAAIRPVYTDSAANLLHLYVDVFELDLNTFFSVVFNGVPDSNLQKKAVTAMLLRSRVFNGAKKLVSAEELFIPVSKGESLGIGVEYNNFNVYGKLPASTKGFAGMLAKGMDILFDSTNNSRVIEMQVTPAYIGDNYILGKTAGLPRIFVTSQKGVSRYNYNGNVEIFRLGEPLYEEITYTGKKAKPYPQVVMSAIRNARNADMSEFVFLRQDGRDVARNKTYLVKMMVQIDPEYRVSGPKAVLSNFIQEPIHYLLNDNDTVATFAVRKGVMNEEGKRLYLNLVTNGLEQSSTFRLDNGSEWSVRYNYVVAGKIAQKDFRITYTGSDNSLKEFYVNGKLLCVAEGATELKKFVLLDNTVAPEFLNQLFIIGFNAFTE